MHKSANFPTIQAEGHKPIIINDRGINYEDIEYSDEDYYYDSDRDYGDGTAVEHINYL